MLASSPNSVKWLLGAEVGGSKLEVRLSVLCSIFSRGQGPVFVHSACHFVSTLNDDQFNFPL